MATTDTELATRLLTALDDLDIEYRVLHRADDIRAHAPISDVDIIVRRAPLDVLRDLVGVSDRHGLAPVMLWDYDRGSLTSFWSAPDGSEGVQLDLLHDPQGHGRYGLRTEEAFRPAHSAVGVWPPRLADRSRLVYLLSKRTAKGDRGRAEEITAILRSHHGVDADDGGARALLSSRSLRRWRRAMHGRHPHRWASSFERWRSRISLRGARRLVEPIGAVVDVTDAELQEVQDLAARFDRFLVRAVALDRAVDAGRARIWWARRTPTLVLVANGEAGRRGGLVATTDSSSVVTALRDDVYRRIGAGTNV